jgi:glucose/mannose transport system permease protein
MAAHDTVERPRESTGEEVDWRRRLRRFVDSDFVRSSPYWGIPFVLMAIAVYGGIGFNLAISLTDTSGLDAPDFGNLDLEMYTAALSDGAVIQAAQNNFVLLVVFTSVSLVLGLFLGGLFTKLSELFLPESAARDFLTTSVTASRSTIRGPVNSSKPTGE